MVCIRRINAVLGGKQLKEILMTTITGMGVGSVFAVFKLPVPAPPVFAGLMGIFGLWLGYGLIGRYIL
jgi:XapX domain-containing protein